MSGIAGIFAPDGSAARQRLERIHRALAHRGGGSEGFYFSGTIGLSHHSRTEAGNTPQPASIGDCWIVADVRLDNREELRRALPGNPEGDSDAELLVRAYNHWGTGCLPRLEGDFAFALWDPSQRRLFCARDPLGIRPFFYRWDSDCLVWATEVKALLADPDYSPAPDEAMVAEFLLGWSHFPDPGATFYRGVRQLPGGHFFLLERGQVRVERYWDIDPAEEGRTLRSPEQNVEEFRLLFERSVAQRLDHSERVAVLLSGGVDSTSVSSMAERLVKSNGRRRQSLSHLSYYIFAPRADERGYVQRFQEKYGCPVEVLATKNLQVLKGIEQGVDLEENPFLDPAWSIVQQWVAYLRERDTRAVLTGFGGDDIFPEGTPTHCADVWQRKGWWEGWRCVRRTAAYYGLPSRALLGPTLRLLLPESLKRMGKRWLGKEISPWVRRDFARRSGLLERVGQPLPRRGFSTLSQELDYRHLTSGRLLLQFGHLDRIAARHGLEFRYPFFYPALVRFTVLAPPEHKIADGATKILLRRAMAGILPEAVRQRRDKGTQDLFMANGIRRHEADLWQMFAKGTQLAAEYVEPAQVQAVVKRFLDGDDSALKPAWQLFSLELWLQRNFATTRATE